MKKIIFRRPFVTKKDRAIARDLLLSSETLMDAAEKEVSANNGDVTLNTTVLIQKACDLMNQAAKRLGFRNSYDMYKYKEKHGKL